MFTSLDSRLVSISFLSVVILFICDGIDDIDDDMWKQVHSMICWLKSNWYLVFSPLFSSCCIVDGFIVSTGVRVDRFARLLFGIQTRSCCVCVCKISTSSLPSRLLITGYVFIKRRPRVWLFSLSITDFTALRWQGNAAIIPPNETVPLISVIFHPILQFVVIVLIFFSIEWKILHSFFLLFFKKEKNPVRYLKGGKSKIKEKRHPLAILSGLLCWLAAQRSARMPASKQQQQQHPLDV